MEVPESGGTPAFVKKKVMYVKEITWVGTAIQEIIKYVPV